MPSWLAQALHGVARAFTVPHSEREKLQQTLQENPALLGHVINLKQSLTMALIHATIPENADPLTSAIAAAGIAQQVERMIPTPAVPEPAPEAAPAPSPEAPIEGELKMPTLALLDSIGTPVDGAHKPFGTGPVPVVPPLETGAAA